MKDPLKTKRIGKPPSRTENATQGALQAERRPPTEGDIPVSTFAGQKAKPLPGQLTIADDPA